jgi:hypothetical protein
MVNEWFKLAKDVDRLPDNQRKPANGRPATLKFKRLK